MWASKAMAMRCRRASDSKAAEAGKMKHSTLLLPRSRCTQRVHPTKLGKASEVAVVGMHLALELDGERCELHVAREVASGAQLAEQAEGDLEVPRAGQEEPHLWAFEPLLDAGDGVFDRERAVEHPRVRREPEKPEDRGRGQTDFGVSVERALPPLARTPVLRKARDVGVKQEVDVGDDHRAGRRSFRRLVSVSSSSARRLSAPESSPGRSAARWGATRYGLAARRDPPGMRPRRIASLTICLNGCRRRWISSSMSRATSGSSVIVVRMEAS